MFFNHLHIVLQLVHADGAIEICIPILLLVSAGFFRADLFVALCKRVVLLITYIHFLFLTFHF